VALPVRNDANDNITPSLVELRAVHGDMYRALGDERDAAIARSTRRAVILPEGSLRDARGLFHEYAFPVAHRAEALEEGQDVQGRFGGLTLSCVVVESGDSEIVLALAQSLGPTIPSGGILTVDAEWMITALQSRVSDGIAIVTKNRSCAVPFNLDAAARVIGRSSFRPRCEEPPSGVLDDGTPLNEEQIGAVRLALGSDVSYIIGPPGTGKTTTLARVVEAHVRQGRSVLVLGPSNRAVDVLMRAVAHRMRSLEGYGEGLIVRFGPRPDTATLGDVTGDICEAELTDRIRRTRFVPALMALGAERSILDARILALLERREASNAFGPQPAPHFLAQLQAMCASAREQLGQILERERQLTAESDRLPANLLAKCKVLGTTIHQTFLSRHLTRQYDVVVIDEASMVQSAQAYVAAGLARPRVGRVVVAGDYRQLPPVFHATSARANAWLGTDIFHTVGIPADLERDDTPPYVATLNVQYRMSPGICTLVSDLFYEGRLRTDRRVRQRTSLPSPLGNTDVFTIDSTPMAPRVRLTADKSRVNEKHVTIIEDLLALLDSGGVIDGHERSVAIITPFRAQADAMRERFGSRYRGKRIAITTGHRSQGGEADIVIFDLTDAPGSYVSKFVEADDLSAEGPRLINVGMSRARHQLYVVGAMEYLQRVGKSPTVNIVRALRRTHRVNLAHLSGSAAALYPGAVRTPAEVRSR
jgi:Superfamily I DNA and RNA helicases and helicase subunits